MSHQKNTAPAPECAFAGYVMAEYEGMMTPDVIADMDAGQRNEYEAYLAHAKTVCAYCDWYRSELGERVFKEASDEVATVEVKEEEAA